MTNSDNTGGNWWKKVRQIIGVCLLVFFIIIHVWFKELPMWFVAMPFALLGVNPLNWLGKGK